MRRGWRRFLTRWQNLLAIAMLAVFVYTAIAAPQLAPPSDPDNAETFKRVGRVTDGVPHPPSAKALLGTTPGQFDMYYSIVWGTRSALRFGLTVALVTAIFGVLTGAISGYVGGWFGSLVMRMTDAFLTFPVIAGVWLFQQVFFPPSPVYLEQAPSSLQATLTSLGLDPLVIALIAFSWMPYARLINATVTRLRQAEFVLASQSLGASAPRILFKHVLPNAISPAIVVLARDVGGMVMLEATFTFIGLGGGSEWGQLLVTNRDWIVGVGGNPLTYWWTYLPPTLALIFFGIGWNLLGDGLNDALNPHHR